MTLHLIKPLTKEELLEKLSRYTRKSILLTLNNNRSTFLSVLKKGRWHLKLSLHQFFLFAEDHVLEAVIRYADKRESEALKILRLFTHKHFTEVDYTDRVKKLHAKGEVYDLNLIYHKVNREYFENALNLSITWFQRPYYRTFRSLTYGSYSRTIKLVRVNNLLDDEKVPPYFVEFIVYHEMLHDVCAPKIDKMGRTRVHTKEFREREKLFEHYDKAMIWEKGAVKIFRRRQRYGRT